MKRGKYPLLEEVEITDIAAEGKAVGRYGDEVVFVSGAVTGDIVDIQVSKKRSRFMEGYIKAFRKYSPLRVEPFCPHFGECGGCKWQMLPYKMQAEFKERQVTEQLRRISGLTLPKTSPIVVADEDRLYRNKLEFTFSNKKWIPRSQAAEDDQFTDKLPGLGFHIPTMFDKVLDIEKCFLQREPSNAIRLWVKEYTIEHGMDYYNLRSHEGLMRNIVIRTSSTTQDIMVTLVFAIEDQRNRQLMSDLAARFPQITSLNWIINDKLNDSVADLPVYNFSGKPYIEETMEGLTFRINPKSFYQTNSHQAYKLYSVAREFAALTGSETVYDLYTGTGTIANFVARQAKKVIGVEYVKEAIDDAKLNSSLNGINNTSFYVGDMKDVLNNEFIEANGHPDVIILDPPRAGIHEDVAAVILRAEPDRIVYVSCNPATQARDLKILSEKYTVQKIQPVDMFPQTHHVESVVLMSKTKKELIGICGLDCEKCDARIATINNDNALREKTAKYWGKLNNIEIPVDAINCMGCRADGVKTLYCENMCEIRKCARSKDFETCGQCENFKTCTILQPIACNHPEAYDNLSKLT